MSDSHQPVGFVAPDAEALAPFFPGYQMHGLIATGGMGAVYCAVQKSLDRTVALKILPMEFSKDAAFCAGFEAEAKAMARLNHPNLISVYDFGEINGMLYIIMEFVPGKSLFHSAHGIAIDPKEVIRLVVGICQGLAHAHENGIIHRDIKPSNILLDLNAQPKIGDFGLARPIERKMEEGEEIFGTPHYTAPEVVDNPRSVDYRADIFSVGVLLHELLTGKLPAHDPRTPSSIIRCDQRFDAIVRRATQQTPAARYASAKEMANDLLAITQMVAPATTKGPRVSAGVGPRRATPVPVYRGRKKSSGSGFLMFLLILTISASVGGYAYLQKNKANDVVVKIPVTAPKPKPIVESDVTEDPEENIHSIEMPSETKEEPVTIERPIQELAPETDTGYIAPVFNVDGFLERARRVMKDKAKSSLSHHRLGLQSNFTDFRQVVGKQVRKMKLGGDRPDDAISAILQGWEDGGSRIPRGYLQRLDMIPDLAASTAGMIPKQDRFDDGLKEALKQLSVTYIKGIEKQVERLQGDNDIGAIELLEKEINFTKNNADYFSGLMLGTSE